MVSVVVSVPRLSWRYAGLPHCSGCSGAPFPSLRPRAWLSQATLMGRTQFKLSEFWFKTIGLRSFCFFLWSLSTGACTGFVWPIICWERRLRSRDWLSALVHLLRPSFRVFWCQGILTQVHLYVYKYILDDRYLRMIEAKVGINSPCQ